MIMIRPVKAIGEVGHMTEHDPSRFVLLFSNLGKTYTNIHNNPK